MNMAWGKNNAWINYATGNVANCIVRGLMAASYALEISVPCPKDCHSYGRDSLEFGPTTKARTVMVLNFYSGWRLSMVNHW